MLFCHIIGLFRKGNSRYLNGQKKKRKRILYVSILGLVAVLNILAWISTPFCDWYITNIFPVWVNTYGRLTGLFPFSVGEILLAAGVLLTLAALVLGIVFVICITVPAYRRKKDRGFTAFIKGFYKVYAWIALGVSLVMTLNCTLLYHGSTFSEKYLWASGEEDYDLETLVAVRNFVVRQCNELSAKVERDESGDIIYEGDMKHSLRELKQCRHWEKPMKACGGFILNPKH